MFYLIPSKYLPIVVLGYNELHKVSVPSILFIDNENGVFTIAPSEPLLYSTSYSVIFDNFPLWMPDITNDDGYTEIYFTDVFINYFTTISHPLLITDISFQKTADIVWSTTENIVVNFNKPITHRDGLLDNIFRIATVEKIVSSEPSEQGYQAVFIPSEASLSNDNMTVTIVPGIPFEPGNQYYLDVRWDDYLGDDFWNQSYGFTVPDRIVLDIKAHFSNGELPGIFNTRGYGGQKISYNLDTVHIRFPVFYDNYFLSQWIINDGVDAPLFHYGELLELILDGDNFFADAQGNSLYKDLKSGIKINAHYSLNPIDTLKLQFQISSQLQNQFPNFLDDIEVHNYLQKINDSTYTHYRYTDNPIIITHKVNDDLVASIFCDSTNTMVPLNATSFPPQYYFQQNTMAMAPQPPFGPGSGKLDTIIIIIAADPFGKPGFCEAPKVSIELHYMGFGEGRPFQDELANIVDMINDISFTFNGKTHYPVFDDSVSGEASKKSSLMSLDMTGISPSSLVKVAFNVSLSNTDYEIFLVDAEYNYLNITSPTQGSVVLIWQGKYGSLIYSDRAVYDNYIYTPHRGFNSIGGEITANIYQKCYNTLKIYIRRKIVEFAYDVESNYKKNDWIAPSFEYFRLEFEEEVQPIHFPEKKYKPYNYSFPENIYQAVTSRNPDPCYASTSLNHSDNGWGLFLGKEQPYIIDGYLRRSCCEEPSIDINFLPRKFIYVDGISTFFYSGETFSYRPYIKDGSGYKLSKMTMPFVSEYDYDQASNSVRIIEYRSPDIVVLSSEEGFRLDYINVPKLNPNGGGYIYVQYAVDDHAANKFDIDLWNSLVLSDYDNGFCLNAGGNGVNDAHTHTLRIEFQFNRDVYFPSLETNIKVRDTNATLKEILRPDSNRSQDYPMKYKYNTDYNDGKIGAVLFTFANHTPANPVNKNGTVHVMCNLQQFLIDITNTEDNPILGGIDIYDINDADTLTNLKSSLTRPVTTFLGSTIPPGVAWRTESFHNINYTSYGKFLLINFPYRPDPVIGSLVLDVTDSTRLPNDHDIFKRDSVGRVQYQAGVKRFPSTGRYNNMGHGDVEIENANHNGWYWNDYLKVNQNLFNLYHWTDDWSKCHKRITNAGNIASIALKIYIALKTGGTDLPLKDAEIENGDTVTKAINLSSELVSEIIDGLVSVAKDLFCSDDESMGTTNFWLARTGHKNSLFNNQWKYWNWKDNSSLGATAPTIDEFNRLYKQEWNIWGVGTYGLYTTVERESHNKRFEYTFKKDVCSVRIIGTLVPQFYTKIRISTGDNR